MSFLATIPFVHEYTVRPDAAYPPAVDKKTLQSCMDDAPRERHPSGGMASLWNMLKDYAGYFLRLQALLTRLTDLVDGPALRDNAVDPAFDPKLSENLKAHRESVWGIFQDVLQDAQAVCVELTLPMSGMRVERLRAKCGGQLSAQEIADLRGAVVELKVTVKDELQGRKFLYVPPERASYWSDAPLFDKNAQEVLPDAVDDMIEAGKCLAVSRYTACVFHLTRVVEVAATRFGKKFNPDLPHKAGLADVVKLAGPKIAEMSGATAEEAEKKGAFSRAVAYLTAYKDGWRNKTMHPGLSYNEEEATLLFRNAREFVRQLAEL